MQAYAIVETGGKQYRVSAGEQLKVERIYSDVGAKVEVGPVLAISDGASLTIGTPEVAGAKVLAEVVKHFRGPKLVAYKKKRRKGYARKIGHRQEMTLLKIDSIA